MALQFRTWWQETIASTIVGGGIFYLVGFVFRRPWSLTEMTLYTGSWAIAYAAIAWYRARQRKTAS